jgi:hypothetical protein
MATMSAGACSDALTAAHAAFDRGEWEQALLGFERVRFMLRHETPRAVHAKGSMCLHRLGRDDIAEAWAQDGLGDQRALLAVGAVRTEAEHLARWSGNRAPVVSILCVTYNHRRCIETAIRGFLSEETSFPFDPHS